MNSEKMKRRLVAILSADVKGYSRLMSVDEEGAVRLLTAYKEVMGNLIRHSMGARSNTVCRRRRQPSQWA